MRTKLSKGTKKLIAGIISATVVTIAIFLFASSQSSMFNFTHSGVDTMENTIYDLFFKAVTRIDEEENYTNEKVSVSKGYDPNILIVDIDEPSLAKLGNYNEWDRSIHANVVRHLTEGGAAAIGFDILFKNADFGQQKANQMLSVLKRLYPKSSWDTLYSTIKESFDYDSMLVNAVKESGNSISCLMFDDSKSYKHETQWRPISTSERADELGYTSTFRLDQADSANNIEPKDLLDNIFPELAKASAQIGSINAYPDEDGVVRRVSLLYRFPNPELYPEATPHIYSTMSLMTVLHLFHQKAENVIIKMGKYIEIGKPFGIYRDAQGSYHTTYPGFSYPMFRALHNKLKSIESDSDEEAKFIDISSKIIVTRHANDEFTFEIFEGQILTPKLSNTLMSLNIETLKSLGEDEVRDLGANITLKHDDEIDGRFILHDDEEDEDAVISPYILSTVHFFRDSIERIPLERPTHLSMDLDIRYDRTTKKWFSNNIILSDKVIRDIQATPDSTINKLKAGEELRFGNVKRIPIDRSGKFLVNYQGRYNTAEFNRAFQHLSYYDVTKNRLDPGFYQGKIFILGSAAPALFDFVPGPHEENNPAVLIHATIIKNILNDSYIVVLDDRYQKIVIALLAILCMLLGLYLKSYLSIGVSILIAIIYTLVAYLYFEDGLYIGVLRQLIAILATNVMALIVQFYYESREKRFLDNAFKQYISPELIDEMVNNEIMPTLGGEKSNITAYFTDIARFSTFSEKIGDPSRLVELLNEYLTAMTDTLLDNKGTLDKYEGDAIIAFFGAPMPLENHAQSACETAVDMQQKLGELRLKWKNEGDKWPTVVHNMHMRIGINSGDIVTGNMGSTMRKNYTMMGDAVNLAARLESAAKQYGAYIQISEDTQKQLKPGFFIYRSLDTIRVIGKSLPVKTYELLGKVGDSDEQELTKLVETWEKARELYLAMQWDEAIKMFTLCLDLEPHHPDRDPGSNLTPSHVYIKRCEQYKVTPPVAEGEIWDGVFTATEK
ncbi:CHASE2 domain-containing protein [uncultured Fibrobacter sp.]|uniref:CHASE2 domain-containing protein n=1 Tax=uncultured Fibrobacter sp. TaxID=261512 RepID=UPI0025CDF7D3|nr:CHASE2 domain-containing protein [uncultured Fibrobacter sp.]MBR3668512.1 adenylate/guanylate cyclase domain-containing protein [Fibrobacter sp.]